MKPPLSLIALSFLLLLSSPVAAYDIKLYPASEVYDAALEFLYERLGVNEQRVWVEDFEDDDIESWLTTNLKAGDEKTVESAWVGRKASAPADFAEFRITLPNARVFGIGLGDDDGGTERLSINGKTPIELSRFPGHEGNGTGRAYFLFIIAQPNDPEIHSIVIDRGMTIAFDHLIVMENKEVSTRPKLAPRMAVRLKEGRPVVGLANIDSISISDGEQRRAVPFERIYSMRVQGQKATVLLRNGERLAGEVRMPQWTLSTKERAIPISWDNVRELTVIPRGEFTVADARSEKLKKEFHAQEPIYEGKSLRAWIAARAERPAVSIHVYDMLSPAYDLESLQQQAATRAIQKIGEAAIPFLLELLSGHARDPRIAAAGFDALGEIGKSALSELLFLLQEPLDPLQYSSIIWSIGHIGPVARAAVPSLIEVLKRNDYASVAAEALGNIGPEAANAVPLMLEKLYSGKLSYDLPIIVALGKIGAQESVPALIAIARGEDSPRPSDLGRLSAALRRHRAVEALGRMGSDAASAVPSLIALLKAHRDPVPHFSERIVDAVGSIGPAAREAVPVLRQMATDSKGAPLQQKLLAVIAKIDRS